MLILLLALPAHAQEQVIGVITSVDGEVKLYEPSKKMARGAAVADLLYIGSRIVTGRGGKAGFIFCPQSLAAETASNTEIVFSADRIEIPAGSLTSRRAVPSCRVPVAAVPRASAERIGGTLLRGQESLTLKSPIGINVVDSRIRFRWMRLDEATEYRLELKDENGNPLWDARTAEDSVNYAGERELDPGRVYRWRVTALQDLEVLSSATGFFRRLSQDEAGRLSDYQRQCAAWARANPRDVAPHLLLAFLYEELQVLDLALEEYRQAAKLTQNPLWLMNKIHSLQERLNPGY